MKRKRPQWWSSRPSKSTKRTSTSHLNCTHWIQKYHDIWRWESLSSCER